jgi:carbon-monoxide dehydrogenase large subunit
MKNQSGCQTTACPRIEVLITEDAPSPFNPLGLKGVGEGGISPDDSRIVTASADKTARIWGAATAKFRIGR